MPGLLKIGKTTSPSERLTELQSTGVPTPFILEACFRVIDINKTEKRIHAVLAKLKHTPNREFFQVSLNEALTECLPIISEFLATPFTGSEKITPRIFEDEEKVLRFIFSETQNNERPTREIIKRKLKFSDNKSDYVFGSLLKKKFVREANEFSPRTSFPRKIMKLESGGIQYLLDNKFITQSDL
jgi:T5orf172 domain